MANKNTHNNTPRSNTSTKDTKKSKYIKPDEIKKLEEMYHNVKCTLYEMNNKPACSIKKKYFRDDNTNDLTRCVITYAFFFGMYVERVDNKGRFLHDKYVPSNHAKGTADLHAIHEGKSYRIEIKCKATKDRQSKEQIEYQNRVEKAGGTYLIVKTFKDFYDFIKDNKWEKIR